MTPLAVPLLRQATDFACGPTCLAMVTACHGRPRSTDELAAAAGTTHDGTDHAGMIAAAMATGARVIAGAGTLDLLAAYVARGLPVIVGWWSMSDADANHDPAWPLAERRARDCGHYSVVVGASAGTIALADPEAGLVELAAEAFDAVWYDTDTAAYDRVDRWFLVLDYAAAGC